MTSQFEEEVGSEESEEVLTKSSKSSEHGVTFPTKN